jgi:membrane associated rhomboid family serine protease
VRKGQPEAPVVPGRNVATAVAPLRSRADAGLPVFFVAMSSRHEILVATAPSLRVSDEWALVLAAEGLEPRIVRAGAGWGVWVEEAEAARAEAALAAYAHENRRRRTAPRHASWPGDAPLVVALSLSAALLLFHLVTGPATSGSDWFERGAATARIVSGEPWRAVTALTLHADPGHALANALAGALFFTLWLRVMGPGIGALLVLGAGVLGNALNAGLQLPSHVSVGASTSVFGAVGLLAGAAGVRRESGVDRRRRPWVVAAASLALLGMLGTGGERTDLWAHAFGLLAGAALGAGAAALYPEPPRSAAQWGGGALLLVGVLGAWRLA